MNLFRCLLLSLLLPVASHALALPDQPAPKAGDDVKAVAGTLSICNNKLCIADNLGHSYYLKSQNFEIRKTLRKLASGDYLEGLGRLDASGEALEVFDISHVGIMNLLGTWQSGTGHVYDFVHFSKVDFYQWELAGAPQNLPPRTLHYRITPADGNHWTVFFIADKVEIGHMLVSHSEVIISFYDPESGEVSRRVWLWPFN